MKIWSVALVLSIGMLGIGAEAQENSVSDENYNVPTVNQFVDALTNPSGTNRNRPEREVWLQDNGFGVFVSLGIDASLGMVMSHSLVGASEDFTERYFTQLPQLFNPKHFDAEELAQLVRLSGARYTVLTTKHHSGFALWDSEATDFDVKATPFGRDMVEQFVTAARGQNLAVGLYYSPEDFHWARSLGISNFDRLTAQNDYLPYRSQFNKLVRTQITELFSNYGKIDIFFNDGEVFGSTNDLVWQLQPDTLITRTAIPTPEQTVPSIGYERAWESIITMTDQWNYKPNDVDRKAPQEVIGTLIETRAKGGALLINVSIKPDGTIPDYDGDMLRTIGAWNFINQEAIFGVRPWVVTHEGTTWFTRSKDGSTLYVFLREEKNWAIGERRQFLLRSVRASDATRVSVLGASGKVVEYRPDLSGRADPRFDQTSDGLKLDIMRTQRIYNDYEWPYPIVVKLENVAKTLDPPAARTLAPTLTEDELILNGELTWLGDQKEVEVAFEMRPYRGFVDDYAAGDGAHEWQRTDVVRLTDTQKFSLALARVRPGQAMVYRAIVLHPSKLVIEGNEAIIDETGNVSMP